MIGHNLKHPRIVSLMLEKITEGENWLERPRQCYKVQIMKYTECKLYFEMKRLLQNKTEAESFSTLVPGPITKQWQ